MAGTFVEAKRQNNGLFTTAEKRVLVWFAEHMPAGINSDHLTAVGFASMVMVGVCFAASRQYPAALVAVVVFLAVNWFGDSLDGTLARVRGHQRPRYGFYIDHVLDTFGILFLIVGLAVSGHMSPLVAAVFLIAYYIVSIEVFLATYSLGRFQMSFWGCGPTELRVLLSIGALMLLVKPVVVIAGHPMPLFDVGGLAGAAGLMFTAVVSAVGNTRRLYAAEPLPSTHMIRE